LEEMGCPDGQKIVLKPARGVSRKFMVLNNKVLIAFVSKGKLFSDCSATSDITKAVRNNMIQYNTIDASLPMPQAAAACKPIPGLATLDLSVTMAPGPNREGEMGRNTLVINNHRAGHVK
jgi:hypothetical protein